MIIYEIVKGKESLDCADIFNRIAIVLNHQGKLNEAFEYYSKALSIYERVKGRESFECAQTLNNIAILYYNNGQLNKAL